MIKTMCLIQVAGLKKDLPDVLAYLHEQQILHLVPTSEKDGPGLHSMQLSAAEEEEKQRLQQYLLELSGFMKVLEISPREPEVSPFSGSLTDFAAAFNPLAEELRDILQERRALKESLELLPLYEKKLKQLIPILPESAASPEFATIGLFISKTHQDVQPHLEAYLQELTEGSVEIIGRDVDSDTRVLMVVAPQQYTTEIETFLGGENIPRLQLPDQVQRRSPNETLQAVQDQIAALPERIAVLDRQLQTYQKKYRTDMIAWFCFLHAHYDDYTARSLIAETEYAFVLRGWLPKDRLAGLQTGLQAAFDQRLAFSVFPDGAVGDLQPPVMLQNPKLIQPFEEPVKLFAFPRYKDLDPTILMSFFLPLFFGMILGDIGYGLVLLLLSLFASNRFKTGLVPKLAKILRFGALWAVVFGFLYGEFFGTLGESLGLHPIWLDRAKGEALVPLILASVAMGALHMVLGLGLGVWQAAVTRSRSHLLERGGMLVGLVGLFFLAAVLADLLPGALLAPAVVVMIVGIVVLAIPIGKAGVIVGPLEFMGLVGNILSYIRIAAVGLASVYLARVANDLAGVVGSIVVGLIIAVLFHALNLVIGAFSPSIHSLRLMYVEFFRKFYTGGGFPYQPFGLPPDLAGEVLE